MLHCCSTYPAGRGRAQSAMIYATCRRGRNARPRLGCPNPTSGPADGVRPMPFRACVAPALGCDIASSQGLHKPKRMATLSCLGRGGRVAEGNGLLRASATLLPSPAESRVPRLHLVRPSVFHLSQRSSVLSGSVCHQFRHQWIVGLGCKADRAQTELRHDVAFTRCSRHRRRDSATQNNGK